MKRRAERKNRKKKTRTAGSGPEEKDLTTTTPLWNKYYEAMRKRLRFPRYYRRAANW